MKLLGEKRLLLSVVLVLVSTIVLMAQNPAPSPAQDNAPPPRDPLGRTSPHDAIVQFLEACHARQYTKAAHYLDLRQLRQSERDKSGPELARQLEDLLDDTPFDIATLSRTPEGDLGDNLAASRERLLTFQSAGQSLELQMERVDLHSGLKVWLGSSDSIPLISRAHQLLQETSFEKRLPQGLVNVEFLDTPLWGWLFLLIAGAAIWFVAGLLAGALAQLIPRFTVLQSAHAEALLGPLRLCVALAAFRAAMELAPPSAIVRLYIDRALMLGFFLVVAWAGAGVTDIIAERWRARLDPRMRAMTYSILPLGRQIVKMFLFLIAVLAALSAWGYNTTTLLAGLGVGGLAVALAGPKTIENRFRGISVIGDRPVLVGDVCRFGNETGTVMHIGLRSTRIRTADRTIISIPNSQFSSMPLENISRRDKIWFHPTLNLRRDTTSDQLLDVLSSFREILKTHPKVEAGNLPVRFVGVGPSSLDVEVVAYVGTADYDEFLPLQQELLLRMLQAVEKAGTALAVPLQESFTLQRAQQV